jgi:endonuclease/exonuclease/phosphatase family metal-dependent hydrolase
MNWKKAGSRILHTIAVLLVILYLAGCLTPYISPEAFPPMALFALAFPFLFLLMVLLLLVYVFIKRRVALILLILLFAGFRNIRHTFAWHRPVAFNMRKKQGDLRVMSWNVGQMGTGLFVSAYRPGHAFFDIVETVDRYKPDVLLFQEFCVAYINPPYEYVSPVQKLDSLGYHYYCFAKDSAETVFTGPVIFSKTPLTDVRKYYLDLSSAVRESVMGATLVQGADTFNLYTAHLTSFRINRNYEAQDVRNYTLQYQSRGEVEKIIKGAVNHAREALLLAGQVQGKRHSILGADLNSTPASYAYNRVRGSLHDAFLENSFGLGTTYTHSFKTLRIDYVFHDDHFEVTQFRLDTTVHASDHYPIIADLRIKN